MSSKTTTTKRNQKREVENKISKKYFGISTINTETRLQDSDMMNINNLYDFADDDMQDESEWLRTLTRVS